MKSKRKENKGKSQLLVGSLLIIIGLILLVFSLIKINFENIKIKKNLSKFYQSQENINDVKKTTILPTAVGLTTSNDSTLNKKEGTVLPTAVGLKQEENYIAVIKIPKINLEKGLYKKESPNNKVNKNIEILKDSDYPNIDKGNFILAGHSGNGRTSYFKKLDRINIDDLVEIVYEGLTYKYKIVNKYEIPKTGIAHIKRNGSKNTITLITCKGNTNKQLVFIGELKK